MWVGAPLAPCWEHPEERTPNLVGGQPAVTSHEPNGDICFCASLAPLFNPIGFRQALKWMPRGLLEPIDKQETPEVSNAGSLELDAGVRGAQWPHAGATGPVWHQVSRSTGILLGDRTRLREWGNCTVPDAGTCLSGTKVQPRLGIWKLQWPCPTGSKQAHSCIFWSNTAGGDICRVPGRRVQAVQEALAGLTGIAAVDQILMCEGIPLAGSKPLSAYSLPVGPYGPCAVLSNAATARKAASGNAGLTLAGSVFCKCTAALVPVVSTHGALGHCMGSVRRGQRSRAWRRCSCQLLHHWLVRQAVPDTTLCAG